MPAADPTPVVIDLNKTEGLMPPPAAPANEQGGALPSSGATPLESLPESWQREFRALRKEIAKYRTVAKTAEDAKLVDEKKWQELADKRQKELDALNAKIAELEKNELRRKVAQAIGLPDELAKRIQGETEDEMTQDAKAILAALPQPPHPPTHNDAKFVSGGAQTLTRDELVQRKTASGYYSGY